MHATSDAQVSGSNPAKSRKCIFTASRLRALTHLKGLLRRQRLGIRQGQKIIRPSHSNLRSQELPRQEKNSQLYSLFDKLFETGYGATQD